MIHTFSNACTNLIIPKVSKYPPLPCVPNGSLNDIITDAMFSLFHTGPNILLPNLQDGHNQVVILNDYTVYCLFKTQPS